jgi:hypothetical protein
MNYLLAVSSVDCFHPSTSSHERIAAGLWNRLTLNSVRMQTIGTQLKDPPHNRLSGCTRHSLHMGGDTQVPMLRGSRSYSDVGSVKRLLL